MSATIYIHELRSRFKSVVIWSGSLIVLILFFFSIFPSFSSQAALLNEMLAKFPPQLLEAFGMGNLDMSNLLGYFGFLFIFVQLCIAIQAGNYGFGLVSVEENELTADFLLSKPVSRLQVMDSKMLAALSSLAITDVAIWACTLICILLFGGDQTFQSSTLILVFLSGVFLQLFFLCVGLVISLLVRRVRSVTPYSLGLAFGSYVINAFSGILGEVKLEYITPFKHLDPAYIVQHSALNTPLVMLNVAITLISIGVSYWLYLHRDIPAVS